MIVDAVGRKVESQVQFWSLLGPFLVLLSIAVLLFKVSIHWYFPVSALIGIPLCVKWKLKGMAVSLCFLLLLSGFGYQSLELEERYWHVGLSLAMAFSFIVMTLSLEEVQGLVAKVQLESQSRLDNFNLLGERLKFVEIEWAEEKEKTQSELSAISMEIARAQEDKVAYHKLAQLAKEELIQVRDQHEKLIQDLFYKKQQISQLQERIEETELSLQGMINSDGEKRILALNDQMTSLEREKEVLKAKIVVFQNENQHLQHKLSFLEEERDSQRESKVSMQEQCEQMRHTESQQRQLLQQAQQKIHELKIQLMEEEQYREIFQLKEKKLENELSRLEKEAEQKEQNCKKSLKDIEAELNKANAKCKLLMEELQCKTTQNEEYRSICDDLEKTKEEGSLLRGQLDSMRQELAAKDGDLQQILQKNHTMTAEIIEKDSQSRQAEAELRELKERNAELEKSYQRIEQRLQQTKEKIEREKEQRASLPYAVGNHRQMEAMFLQLKEQFNEKCRVLDAARRELFKVQEQLLKRQKEEEEERVYGLSPEEKSLQMNYLRVAREYERTEQRDCTEIDELNELITSLFSELSKK